MKIRREIQYEPLPSQLRFHDSTARFKGFSGPIGSGKSQALCNEAIKLAYLNPGRAGLIGAPTYPMLRDATQTSLFEVLRDNGLPFDFNKAENQLTLKDTGSKIIFRPLDDFERLRGTNLAWFGVDELTYSPEQAWIRLEGRLRDPLAARLCGFAVWTPKGFDWVYERFIQNPVDGYECVQAEPNENRHLLEKVPDFYDRLKRSYDEAFFAQEVLGQYVSPKDGMVYHAFDRKENVGAAEWDAELPVLWALDFNVNPMSSIVAQQQAGRLVVLDEIVLQRASTRDACLEFTRRYPEWPAGLEIFADACASHLQTAGTTDREILQGFFEEYGGSAPVFRIPKRNPPVRDRVGLVNAKLRSANGETGLMVDARCKELMLDFERVRWLEGTGEIDKARDLKRTHLSDAVGYLLWQENQPVASIGERNRRLFW
ncbi:terminase large subunit domain-containing protein [Paludibaculum fermentans]|uniref:terminase large subunit domain-containing protein n=1 Tax=Paludibaculum fermentans TaxID=1473598 RepID=UPI003EBDEF4F